MSQDIFTADFAVTTPTYIIAPGWEGRDHYHKVPADAFTIAVNKGIQAPCHHNIWLAEDMGMLKLHPWFEGRVESLIKLNEPPESYIATPVFGKGKMTKRFPRVKYHYESGSMLSSHPEHKPMPGVLRGGATIASKAAQLAFNKGCRHIILVGVDMRGRKYFDGTKTTSTMINDENLWWCVHKWKKLLANLRVMRCKVESLSPTALDVGVVE